MKRINENTIALSFEREGSDWFAVINEWEGDWAELQMVAGADTMCEILAQGEDLVHTTLTIDKAPEKYRIKLVKLDDTPESGGAIYFSHWSEEFKIKPFQLWLCDVTRHVFGKMPTEIYIN